MRRDEAGKRARDVMASHGAALASGAWDRLAAELRRRLGATEQEISGTTGGEPEEAVTLDEELYGEDDKPTVGAFGAVGAVGVVEAEMSSAPASEVHHGPTHPIARPPSPNHPVWPFSTAGPKRERGRRGSAAHRGGPGETGCRHPPSCGPPRPGGPENHSSEPLHTLT